MKYLDYCVFFLYSQFSIVQMAVFTMESAWVRYVSVIRDGLEKTALNFTAMIYTTVPVSANVWVLMCASVIRDIWYVCFFFALQFEGEIMLEISITFYVDLTSLWRLR